MWRALRRATVLHMAHFQDGAKCLESSAMSIRHEVRVTVALIAAYAVALQTILLAFAAAEPGLAPMAAVPLCAANSSGASGPNDPAGPPSHSHDCIAACLTGCCGGAAAVPNPVVSIAFMPGLARAVAAPIAAKSVLPAGIAAAHRSRAPPVG
jgi:hypothetical protein